MADERLVAEFIQQLEMFYASSGRHDLPWRIPEPDGSYDPYRILVSEIMLQQTQVSRVISKYQEFLQLFPDAGSLAGASLGQVLQAWTGLGYNRRAKYLWQAAQVIRDHYGGRFPQTIDELVRLPGVGRNTAGAIVAYAFNRPAVFIETNVRTVYIHHFFGERAQVDDKELLPLIEQTLQREEPRIFYWMLMDYGTYLKQSVGNLSRRSKHYARQSKFEGSVRQIRGAVIRQLANGPLDLQELRAAIADDRLPPVLDDLTREELIRRDRDTYRLA